MRKIFLCLLLLSGLDSCILFRQYDNRWARNYNTCKKLQGKVVLYAIFVDTRYTKPFTDYDITSTTDSIQKAIDWIEAKANVEGIPLDIELKIYKNEKQITVSKDLPLKTIYKTAVFGGIGMLNRWADAVAKKAGSTMELANKPLIPKTRKPSDRERLVAKIRDEEGAESVALMYFVNNYYMEDLSLACNITLLTNGELEYAIVSFKDPAVIAHEFLHLFGAPDLYKSPFGKRRSRNVRFVKREFPNEIMLTCDPQLNKLDLCPATKYLVGWSDVIDRKYERLIYDHRFTRRRR